MLFEQQENAEHSTNGNLIYVNYLSHNLYRKFLQEQLCL